MKTKEQLTKNRILFNGIWFPVQQINYWQDYYSGTLEKNPNTQKGLELATLHFIKEKGRIPFYVTIRDNPFNWYFPIKVKAEIFGTGLKDVDTNKFIFIRSRRVY